MPPREEPPDSLRLPESWEEMHLPCVPSDSTACVLGPLDGVSRRWALSSRDIKSPVLWGLGMFRRKGVLELWQHHPYPGVAVVMVELGLCQGNTKSIEQRHDMIPGAGVPSGEMGGDSTQLAWSG